MLLGLAFCAWPALAQFERLDDSSSPRGQVSTGLERASMLDANRFSVPFGRVEYRLNTAIYIGQRARIYYRIPQAIAGVASPAGLQLEWRGSGLFADGSARPGERVPVWQGVVSDEWIDEALELTLVFDRRYLLPVGSGGLRFESYFEIEVMP